MVFIIKIRGLFFWKIKISYNYYSKPAFQTILDKSNRKASKIWGIKVVTFTLDQ